MNEEGHVTYQLFSRNYYHLDLFETIEMRESGIIRYGTFYATEIKTFPYLEGVFA